MQKRSIATLAILILGTVAAQLPEGEEAILEEEVLAPELDWQDPEWTPLYLHYEDPASVDCGGRQACQEALQNATEVQ